MQLNYVYVIENKFTRLCKIGKSKRPIERMEEICRMAGIVNPQTFISDAVVRHEVLETMAHRQFSNKRIVGEWFDVSFSDAVNYIERIIKKNNVINTPKKASQSSGISELKFLSLIGKKDLSPTEIIDHCNSMAKELQMLVTINGLRTLHYNNMQITNIDRDNLVSKDSLYVKKYAIYFAATKDFSLLYKYRSINLEVDDKNWGIEYKALIDWYETVEDSIKNCTFIGAKWDDSINFFIKLHQDANIQQGQLL